MLKKRSTVLLAVTVAIGALVCQAKESVAFKPPPGWKVANSESSKEMTLVELVKDGDTIEGWNELITVQNLVRPKGIRNLDDFFSRLKAIREEDCPGVTTWHVIEQSQDATTYEWSTSGPCRGQPVQTELARIFWAKKDIWMFHYARKVNALSSDDRELWLQWLKQLQLTGKE